MTAANDNPAPEATYQQRINDVFAAIVGKGTEVVGEANLDKAHAAPQQFQSFAIMAYAGDLTGENINFNMVSNAACLPEFSAFILATACARGLAHIAQQVVGMDDPAAMAKTHDTLRNVFMEHLMGAFGLGAIIGQVPAEGKA